MQGAGTQLSAPLLILFMITLLTPIAFEIAGVRLSPNRIFLLIVIFPYAARIISGQIGRFTAVDLLFVLHGVWIFIALIAVHGTNRIPFAAITAVELIGGYFVGRVLIRDITGYRLLFRIMMIALIVLLPFALVEAVTGKLIIPDLLRPVFQTPFRGDSAYGRMGLERVYVVFDHPILWGLFCSLTLANFIKMARGNLLKIGFGASLSIFTTMLSLSSAPLMACGLQLSMLAWGWIMRGRWKLLLILTVVGYVVIDLLSNRTPVTILIDTLTFNPGTGYTRIAIFDAGWAAVKGSPFFGIGFNDWPRPFWVTASVDNFWLLTAMRYGFVGVSFLVLALLSHFVLMARARITDPQALAIRIGHAIALAGISFTMVTVHVWGTMSVFVMFYIGAGAWMYAYAPQDGHDDITAQTEVAASGPLYSRFAPRPARAGSTQRSQTLSRRQGETTEQGRV
ncbi:O-Antigen ligase [Loktanella atrilutea]|uniref:O-Antigen ligase n=2 Tax=Loktanella atrilutea TaxID=366533 RepID=A0A1M5F5A7_LOKAT|nr:O-Antigen ligase [Loktanella atrilutea]